MLWTKSNNIADKLIWLLTGEDCAHFAFVFESSGGGMVFESNLLGTHPAFLKTWLKNHTVIHEKKIELTTEQEDALWDKWVTQFDGEEYDFWGCIYTGIMKARKRIFKTAMPKKNPWTTRDSFYCDEVYQLVSGMPGFPLIALDDNELDSPHDVWDKVNI